MKDIMTVVLNRVERGRVEELNGIAYTVYPVIMLTVGVHAGSGGPTLYTEAELSSFSQTWNGVPVTLQHPEEEGMPVSANSPAIYETQVLGTVFNTRYEDGKLKAEIWLRNSDLEQLEPGLKGRLMSGERLEVSTGLFSEDDGEVGLFNGVEYNSTAFNIRPDHLALLPGAIGACSWEDGCGVRANKEGKQGGSMIKKKKIKVYKEQDKNPYEFFVNTGEFTINEIEYTQILEIMSNKIDSMDIRGEKFHYMRRMYQNYCIYKVHIVGGSEPNKMYKRNYSITDGKIEWTSDPVEVNMTESFTEIQNNVSVVDEGNEGGEGNKNKIVVKTKTKEKEMKTMKECCPDKVDELIANNENFKEEDKDTLLAMSEDAFALTINKAKPIEKVVEKVVENEEDKEVSTFDELLANATPELQESIKYGKSLVENKKADFIKIIKANENNKFSDEELKAFDMDHLDKLASMTPKVNNYSLNGDGNDPITNTKIKAVPDPYDWETKEKA